MIETHVDPDLCNVDPDLCHIDPVLHDLDPDLYDFIVIYIWIYMMDKSYRSGSIRWTSHIDPDLHGGRVM